MPPKGKKSTGPTLSGSSLTLPNPITALVMQVTQMENTLSTLVRRIKTLKQRQLTALTPTPSAAPAVVATATTTPSCGCPCRKKISSTNTVLRPSTTTAVPLSAYHPRDTLPDHYTTLVILTDDLMGHVVGHSRQGLKQISDLSGARLLAFSQKVEGREEHLVTIRGTEQQLGDALSIIGKCMAYKHVHAPKKKGVRFPSIVAPTPTIPVSPAVPLEGSSCSASAPSRLGPQPAPPVLQLQPAPSLASVSPTSTPQPRPMLSLSGPRSTPTTPAPLSCQVLGVGSPMPISTPTGTSTPVVPSVAMASLSSSRALTPMDIDIIIAAIGPHKNEFPAFQHARALHAVECGEVICMLDGWELPEKEES